jgi:hypothetical protein
VEKLVAGSPQDHYTTFVKACLKLENAKWCFLAIHMASVALLVLKPPVSAIHRSYSAETGDARHKPLTPMTEDLQRILWYLTISILILYGIDRAVRWHSRLYREARAEESGPSPLAVLRFPVVCGFAFVGAVFVAGPVGALAKYYGYGITIPHLNELPYHGAVAAGMVVHFGTRYAYKYYIRTASFIYLSGLAIAAFEFPGAPFRYGQDTPELWSPFLGTAAGGFLVWFWICLREKIWPTPHPVEKARRTPKIARLRATW